MNLQETIAEIVPTDREAAAAAKQRFDSIAKPLGSLGKWEEGVEKLAAVAGTPDVRCDRKALLVFCADNGIVAEGVSQSGPDVTARVAENFLDGRTCTSVLAAQAGVDVFPVDIGMAADTRVPREGKIAHGTKNFRWEPAMTRSQTVAAIETGIRQVQNCREKGYQILAAGEMGIGNTTTSSAVTAVLLDLPVREVTGRGAGLSDEGLERKIRVIGEAIERHRPDPSDPVDVLSRVGGLDLAGLTGVFLGAAALRIPVVLDGFISAAAALAACRLAPVSAEYMLASHRPAEPAGMRVLDALGLDPWLDCHLRLGEGSGAVALLSLLDLALSVYREAPTFSQIGLEAYVPQ